MRDALCLFIKHKYVTIERLSMHSSMWYKKICNWIEVRYQEMKSVHTVWKVWDWKICKIKVEQKVCLATFFAVMYHLWKARKHAYWKASDILSVGCSASDYSY